jgi:hypothetical protein
MIKTSTIKNKRAASVNGKYKGKALPVKTESKVLDFAGAWNELPNEKLKALDATLANRRKSTARRTGL